MLVYLRPLIVLGVVGLHDVQVRLAIVSAHGVKPVAQQANPHRIPGDAEGRHGGPHVCLWVIPAITSVSADCLSPGRGAKACFMLTLLYDVFKSACYRT